MWLQNPVLTVHNVEGSHGRIRDSGETWRIWWVSARSLAEQAERMEIPRPPATDLRMASRSFMQGVQLCQGRSGIFVFQISGQFPFWFQNQFRA